MGAIREAEGRGVTEGLRERCQGRWSGILPMMGIDARHLTGRHGPCPLCGGTDRFRYDDKDGRGTWICSKCGAGDGMSLVMRSKGWGFRDLAPELEAIVGKVPRQVETRRARSEKELREAMNRLWTGGRPVERGDAVARYLEQRAIVLKDYPAALRCHEKARYQGAETLYFPAMLAKVVAPDGVPCTIHRTYLAEDGRKAPVGEPRRLMPGKIAKGAAIRLAPAGKVLGIAEGIETALSAAIIWRLPCWAAVSAGMLMAWEPPAEVREVIVFGDRDSSFAGQQAAYALAHRLSVRGISVRVELPIDEGMDWNDVLMAERAVAA